MSRTFVALMGAAVLSVAVVSAQSKPADKADNAKGTKFSGCLVQGSAPDTYNLISASQKGSKNPDNGKLSFKVVAANDKVKLAPQVSKAVEIEGTADGEGVKAGSVAVLPTLTATKVSWKADYCG